MRFSRRSAFTHAGLAVAAASMTACRDVASPASGFQRPGHLVDLTHTLSPTFPFIPVQNKTFPFRMSPIVTVKIDGVYANRWELTEHVGTHFDAPCHFIENGTAVDQVPVSKLVVPLAVVSIADRAATERIGRPWGQRGASPPARGD